MSPTLAEGTDSAAEATLSGMPQPESSQEYAARIFAAQAAGPQGRLPLIDDGFTTWPTFPFDGDLRVREVMALADEEPRFGEDPATCWCAPGAEMRPGADRWPVVWRDEHWHIKAAPPSGAPCVLILEPLEHADLSALSPQRAAEFGQISVALSASVEALPSVGRCHIGRWGDGGAHAHVWFIARPARMPQTRGTFMALWDDYFPPVPVAVRDANAAAAIRGLVAAYGGHAL